MKSRQHCYDKKMTVLSGQEIRAIYPTMEYTNSSENHRTTQCIQVIIAECIQYLQGCQEKRACIRGKVLPQRFTEWLEIAQVRDKKNSQN